MAACVLTWRGAHPDDAQLLLRFALRDLLRILRSGHIPTDADIAAVRRAATLLLG